MIKIISATVAGVLAMTAFALAEEPAAVTMYKRDRAAFLRTVEDLHFAAECGIIGKFQAVMIERNLFPMSARHGIYFDDSLGDMIEAAHSAGWARGQRPGQCDLWKKHPETVQRLREAAAMAMGGM